MSGSDGSLHLESDRRLRAILDNSFEFIGLLDVDGILIEVNKGALDFCGLDISEVINKPFWETAWWVHSKEMQKQLREGIKKAAQGEFVRFEATHLDKNKVLYHIDFSLNPVRGKEGAVIYIIPEGRDITERKKREMELETYHHNLEKLIKERTALLESDIAQRKKTEELLRESEKRLNDMFDSANDGILIADIESKRFIICNNMMCKMLGYNRNELLALGIYDIHPQEDLPVIIDKFEKLNNKTITIARDIPLKRKDGNVIYADITSSSIIIEGRRCSAGFFRDIGYRRDYEIALRESEEKFRSIFEGSSIGMAIASIEGRWLQVNETFCRMLGYAQDELLSKSISEVTHPEDIKKSLEYMQRMTLGEIKHYQLERRYLDKYGNVVWAILNASLIRDEENKPLYFVGVIQDVTERKKMEQALSEAKDNLELRVQKRTNELALKNVELQEEIRSRAEKEAQISSLQKQVEFILGATNTGLDIIDSDYNMRYINASWEKIYGPYQGRKCYEYFMGKKFPCPGCAIKKALETKKSVVSEETLGRENNRPIEVTTIPFQDQNGEWLVAEINVDISERKKQEDALRQSEQRYHNIISTITDYIYTVHLWEGQTIGVVHGEACLAVTGYSAKEFDDDAYLWINMVFEGDRAIVQKWVLDITTGNKPGPIEHRIIRKDGQMRWIRNTPVYHYDNQGKLSYYEGVVQDITEHKQAEQERIRLEAISSIIEGMPDAILVLDNSGKIIDFNRALTVNYGIDREIIGKDFELLLPKKYRKCLKDASGRFIFQDAHSNIEVALIGKDRVEIPVLIDSSSFFNPNRKDYNVIIVITNITELKKIEKMKDDFMNTISHELRTPLSAVKEAVTLVADGITGSIDNDKKECLEIAKSNIDRLVRLISDMLDMQKIAAEKMPLDFTKNNINEIIKHVYKSMLVLASAKKLRLALELDDSIPMLDTDKDRIEQVLANLLNNAIKFSNKGEIRISSFRNGDCVRVSVSDTGIGISSEDLPRLFKKFEQIKSRTQGTGLGLVIAKEIIELHGGRIWAESNLSKGTTITFELPIK